MTAIRYGAIQVLASVATKVYAGWAVSGGVLVDSLEIFNNGPYIIWVGGDANVTTLTGRPVYPGTSYTYTDNPNGGVWAIASTADQVSPTDTRWQAEPSNP